jgi:uncharacterized beta-barrel protein YwiB (DUF1934 family)
VNRKDSKKVLISIKGLPVFANSDDDAFELMTDGEYSQTEELSTFSYIESSLTGLDGSLTTFDVEKDRVVLKRGDGLSGDMIFSENQKHHFLYDTPFGSVMLGIDTHSITKNMRDDGGNIEIRYDIEVDNVAVSQNVFKINIRSLSQ